MCCAIDRPLEPPTSSGPPGIACLSYHYSSEPLVIYCCTMWIVCLPSINSGCVPGSGLCHNRADLPSLSKHLQLWERHLPGGVCLCSRHWVSLHRELCLHPAGGEWLRPAWFEFGEEFGSGLRQCGFCSDTMLRIRMVGCICVHAVLGFLWSSKPIHVFLGQVLWAFSIYLESVAILPQLFMIIKTGEAESITTHYLFFLGLYRALYLANWVWRYYTEGFFDQISVVSGVVQTIFYCDFFYLYITRG